MHLQLLLHSCLLAVFGLLHVRWTRAEPVYHWPQALVACKVEQDLLLVGKCPLLLVLVEALQKEAESKTNLFVPVQQALAPAAHLIKKRLILEGFTLHV